MSQDKDLARLVDEAALLQLCVRYAQCVDRRDGAGFAALFAPGAVLQGKDRKFSTPAQLAEIPDKNIKIYEKTYHTLSNTSFEIDGDHATGEIYSAAHHLTPGGGGKYTNLIMYITYRDRYVRDGKKWLFEHRNVRTEFTQSTLVENVAK